MTTEKMSSFNGQARKLDPKILEGLFDYKQAKYVLKKKDDVLIAFTLEFGLFGDVSCEDIEVYSGILPYGLEPTAKSIMSWLDSRFIPKYRAYVDRVIKVLDPDKPRLLGLLDVTLGLSLTDDYWVVSEDKLNLKWDDYNLYDHDFSDDLSLIAFTGHGSLRATGFISSPEFTTNGMLKKSWRRINNEIYLYKGGSEGYSNAGMEPYSEFFASQVASCMGINYVPYDLARWKGNLCSTCKLFTSKDVSLVPFYLVHRDIKMSEFFRIPDDSVRHDLVTMLLFDLIILNEDRHQGNFGYLRDNNTGELLGIAPLFDHGLSLLYQLPEYELNDWSDYIQRRSYGFVNAPAKALRDLAGLFRSKEHRRMVRKLIGFELEQHDKYKISDARLRVLNTLINERACALLQSI